MKKLLLFIFLLPLSVLAQDVSGVWTGTLFQDEDRKYYFEINVQEIDFNGYLKGVTYIKEKSSGNDGTIAFTGSFKKGVFTFKESEIVKEVKDNNGGYYSTNTWYWCIKSGELNFQELNGKYYLKGPWSAENNCPGGTLVVSKDKPEEDKDACENIQSAEMMLGAWKGKFHQHGCNIYETFPMVVLIDRYDGMRFYGQFIWTDMGNYAQDSRSTLEGEIKDGKVFFYENELISGGGLVLNGTYQSDFVDCDNLDGFWFTEKLQPDCQDKQVLKNGGDYELEHYIIPTIYFDHESSELTLKAIADLNEFVRFLRDFPSMKFEMSGHTDDSGSNAFNLTLSKKRAQMVIDYLVSKGISANRFSYTFHAHSKPAEKNNSEENMQLNRRVEISLKPAT